MAHLDDVFINTDADLDEVAATIQRVTASRPLGPDPAGDLRFAVSELVTLFLDHANYVNEPGLPLGDYRYVLQIQDLTAAESDPQRRLAAQRATAQHVYDALATETSWALLLVVDDLNELVATRPPLARSA